MQNEISIKYFKVPEFQGAKKIWHKNKLIFANENEKASLPPKVALKQVFSYYTTRVKNAAPKKKLAFVRSDFKADFNTPHLAWLGHSSAFLSFKNFKMLIDPLFTMRASPIGFINRAFKQAPCFEASEFGEPLAVLITHSHFDHLDKKSILKLKNRAFVFIAPLNVGRYLRKMGVLKERILELDWGDGLEFCLDEHCFINLYCLSSQHNSNRADGFNKSLWASFAFEFSGKFGLKKLFWSADGGYFTHFKKFGAFFNGFDLACLESGHFNKAWAHSHSFPEQILKEAQDLRARAVMSIHWARFKAGIHGWAEPVSFLYENFKKLQIPYLTPKIGQLIDLSKDLSKRENIENLQEKWWQE